MLWESQACRLLEGTIFCVSYHVPGAKTVSDTRAHQLFVELNWQFDAGKRMVVSGVRLILVRSLALPLGDWGQVTSLPRASVCKVLSGLTESAGMKHCPWSLGSTECLVKDRSRMNPHPSHPFSARAFYFSKCSWFKRKHFQRKPS